MADRPGPATVVVDLVVDALAAYRLTRLVTKDVLTQPWRERFIEWTFRATPEEPPEDGPAMWQEYVEDHVDPPKLATLVTCRWCAGAWVSLGVVAFRTAAPGAWRRVGRVFALSAVAALIAGLEDHDG